MARQSTARRCPTATVSAVCLVFGVILLGAARVDAQPVRQLLHNEDETDFFWHDRIPPGKAGETIDRYVDVMADAGVTVFLCNTNARRTNYRSGVWEAYWDGYDPAGPDDQPFLAPMPREEVAAFRKGVDNMLAVHKQGIDYPGRVVARCRHRGISPWITLRMNDCHYNDIPDHPFHGTFWKKNPQLKRKNCSGYFATCLDYASPAVRDYFKALVAESLQRYDIDGLELDFMREPYLFSAGKEAEGAAILTAWMREVRELTKQAALTRGHPVRLGVRVPSRPEVAAAMGLDALAWAKLGLVDQLVVTPRWATLEFDMPIREWRELLGKAKVTLAGGLEVRYQPSPGGPASAVTPELATGAAVSVLSQGADAVYLFNFFQSGHPAWTRPVYRNTLGAMASLDSLLKLPRCVGITYRDITAPGENYQPPLPATGREIALPIRLGPIPDNRWPCELLIGLALSQGPAFPAPAALVNGTPCAVRSDTTRDGLRLISFSVPSSALAGTELHQFKLASKDERPLKVDRVEMSLKKPDGPGGKDLGDAAPPARIAAGDAFIQPGTDGRSWTIGAAAVRVALDCGNGRLRLTKFQNRLVDPPQEYVDAVHAAAPFALQAPPSTTGRYVVETLWSKFRPAPATVDPANDELQVDVKKGDLIGFSVGPHGDYSGDETDWVTTVEYGPGERYVSSKDTRLAQGPVWHYLLHRPGTGDLDSIDAVEAMAYSEEKVRIPSQASGRRAPGDTPHVGPTKMHPSPTYDAVRGWRAPRDGRVSISGPARRFKGYGDTDVRVLRFREKPPGYVPPPPREEPWSLESAKSRVVDAGGRPAVQLDLALRNQALRAHYHLLAYPRTAVLRQWVTLENASGAPLSLDSPMPACFRLRGDDGGRWVQHWLIGGNSGPTQGLLQTRPLAPSYQQGFEGQMTDDFVPWTALHRQDGPEGGLFVALEYLGGWRLAVERSLGGATSLAASIPELNSKSLRPGERIDLPLVTLGAFSHGLEQMSAQLYDWQYEYLWDYTHDDWYALLSYPVPWWPESRNLQENFAGRLGKLDVEGVDAMRDLGFELLWDDAGWSESPNIWAPTREGPDFAQTLRYLDKCGMKWCLWFCGRPSAGLMDGKIGAWGNFQWRTDGVGGFDILTDPAYREQITRFLRRHSRASFHTCNGGGRYAHTFEIQRYTDVNYFSDAGRGDQTNHYFSYLDTPDKWLDIITAYQKGGRFDPANGRMVLTMAPTWYLRMTPQDHQQVRLLGEIYHFLLREGVAGRWSYACHPTVLGDVEHQYFQRTSHDRAKACIILKHKPPGEVTIFPRGLLPGRRYTVGFDSNRTVETREGAELMARGIRLRSPPPGELIYLGLPHRPHGGTDRVAPTAPGRVLSKRETNLGHTGVGVYWSPAADNGSVSYYEVRRDGKTLGKAATGTYYFDHAPGWNPRGAYAVRAVDTDANAGPWRSADSLPDEPLEAASLGGHFPEAGREGWRAEATADGRAFTAMNWVPPVKDSAGDLGGVANQAGGAEGYWEGPGGARVGRGWQQAAATVQSVRAWTASQSGTVRVLGRAVKEHYRRSEGEPLRVRILHGQAQVWPPRNWAVVPLRDPAGVSHDLTFTVAQGDTIRFVLDKAARPEAAVVAWMPRVVYVAEAESPRNVSVVRVLCGAEKPYTDRCGNVWSADAFFSGGAPHSTTAAVAGATPSENDQALYQAGRAGREFVYAIPVKTGLYAVRLKWAEPTLDWFFERPMNLDLNGRRVLRDFDVCHAARGPRRAYERVFRYVVPDADGKIVLHFRGGSDPLKTCDEAIVQAIEVLPEEKSLVRINAGSARPWIDWNGVVWAADHAFNGGRALDASTPVAQASPTLYDQPLYHTARTGKSFAYVVPVAPGLYTVNLKFAELWQREPGRRPMRIEVNGRTIFTAWDPAAAAGEPNTAADLRVEDVCPDASGCITLRLTAAGPNEAVLQALEIR